MLTAKTKTQRRCGCSASKADLLQQHDRVRIFGTPKPLELNMKAAAEQMREEFCLQPAAGLRADDLGGSELAVLYDPGCRGVLREGPHGGCAERSTTVSRDRRGQGGVADSEQGFVRRRGTRAGATGRPPARAGPPLPIETQSSPMPADSSLGLHQDRAPTATSSGGARSRKAGPAGFIWAAGVCL